MKKYFLKNLTIMILNIHPIEKLILKKKILNFHMTLESSILAESITFFFKIIMLNLIFINQCLK